MTAIFEREHKNVELKYDELNEEYVLTVPGFLWSEVEFYFNKNGKYTGCVGCTNS
jgi:hypothetical protein